MRGPVRVSRVRLSNSNGRRSLRHVVRQRSPGTTSASLDGQVAALPGLGPGAQSGNFRSRCRKALRLGWSGLFRQRVGEFKVDVALLVPVSPGEVHLNALSGIPGPPHASPTDRKDSRRLAGGGRAVGIEEFALAQHGAAHGEQPVGDRAQGASVRMAALAQGPILGAADGIVLDRDAAPVIGGVDQARLGGPAAEDPPCLAGALGDRGHPAQAAEGFVVSGMQRSGSLCEQLGEDGSPDARQRREDLRVTLLSRLPRWARSPTCAVAASTTPGAVVTGPARVAGSWKNVVWELGGGRWSERVPYPAPVCCDTSRPVPAPAWSLRTNGSAWLDHEQLVGRPSRPVVPTRAARRPPQAATRDSSANLGRTLGVRTRNRPPIHRSRRPNWLLSFSSGALAPRRTCQYSSTCHAQPTLRGCRTGPIERHRLPIRTVTTRCARQRRAVPAPATDPPRVRSPRTLQPILLRLESSKAHCQSES